MRRCPQELGISLAGAGLEDSADRGGGRAGSHSSSTSALCFDTEPVACVVPWRLGESSGASRAKALMRTRAGLRWDRTRAKSTAHRHDYNER